MSMVFNMRYKIDLAVNEDGPPSGAKSTEKNPIGVTTELCGTKGEIKERICHEIDKITFQLEDLYFDKGE